MQVLHALPVDSNAITHTVYISSMSVTVTMTVETCLMNRTATVLPPVSICTR